MRVAAITFEEFFDTPESAALIADYCAECGTLGLQPNPDRETYETLGRAGSAHMLAAFDEPRGVMVGFAVLIVHKNAHFGVELGVLESIYASPYARASGVGAQLLEAVRNLARSEGAVSLLISATVGSQFERLLAARGVPHVSNVYLEHLQ